MRIRFTIDISRSPKPVPDEDDEPERQGADSVTEIGWPDKSTHRMGFAPAPFDDPE